MTLLELLRQELPKRGGWPEGVRSIAQCHNGQIWYDNNKVNLRLEHVAKNARKLYRQFVDGESNVTREQYEAIGWDGTNLPPVGCECEYSWAGEPWASGVIRYISKHTIIIETQADSTGDTECAYHPTDIKLRPLRTEAERAIDEMVRLSGVSIGAAKILYDAGYRKG